VDADKGIRRLNYGEGKGSEIDRVIMHCSRPCSFTRLTDQDLRRHVIIISSFNLFFSLSPIPFI
jgi:hypothetical protein